MKILKLPLLALESVLVKFRLCDLVQFTFISKRCFHIAKCMKTPRAVLNIEVIKRYVKFKVFFGGVTVLEWWHYCEEKMLRRASVASIGNRQIRTLHYNGRIFSMEEENNEECAKEIVNYLKELFLCSIRVVFLYPDDIIAPQRSILTFHNECREIYIEGERETTYEELWNILDNWKPTENIMIGLKFGGEYKDLFTWTTPKSLLIHKHAQWITIDMVLNLKVVDLSLYSCSLTTKDIQVFINNWFDSNCTNFRSLYLRWKFPKPADLNLMALDLRMPLMPFERERRNNAHICYPKYAVNCEDGMDILRSDGLLATIKIYPSFFYFCVWHDRFPDMTGIRIMYPPLV